MSRVVRITRIERFAAAHRLYIKSKSPEENYEIFNKCSWKNGHGHNYTVHYTVKGPVDPITGMVVNIDLMKVAIKSVLDKVDHKFLDEDVPFFHQNPSTVENICIFFWEELEGALPPGVEVEKIKIYETDNNYAVYKG